MSCQVFALIFVLNMGLASVLWLRVDDERELLSGKSDHGNWMHAGAARCSRKGPDSGSWVFVFFFFFVVRL